MVECELLLKRIREYIKIGKRHMPVENADGQRWLQTLLDWGFFSLDDFWETVAAFSKEDYFNGPLPCQSSSQPDVLTDWEFKILLNDKPVCIRLKEDSEGRGCVFVGIYPI